ncbi:MAG: phosphoglycerate kinase [Minisyncoccia bacterium]
MINFKDKDLLRKNPKKVKDKDVLLRVDYNVDIEKGKIFDDYRILKSFDTINFLKKAGARKIILISHLGRPNGFDEKYSLKKIYLYLKKRLKDISFIKWKPGENIDNHKIILLENIRFFKGEEENDEKFAKELSKLGDIFVNDAFSVSHRKHASVYGIKKFLPTLYGLNFEKEINNLNRVFKAKNLGIIIGGIKTDTKIGVIKKFLNRANLIILGGGIANTFLKAKGFEIGNSIYDKEYIDYLKKINNPKILTPFDFITNNGYKFLGEISKDDSILDIGEESIRVFISELKRVKTIVWNGPFGKIEDKKYSKGTIKFLKELVKLKGEKIVGGGDTIKLINKLKLDKKFDFVSTGGGAMLEYLSSGKLPIL